MVTKLRVGKFYHIKWVDTNTDRQSLIRVLSRENEREFRIIKLADNWEHGTDYAPIDLPCYLEDETFEKIKDSTDEVDVTSFPLFIGWPQTGKKLSRYLSRR